MVLPERWAESMNSRNTVLAAAALIGLISGAVLASRSGHEIPRTESFTQPGQAASRLASSSPTGSAVPVTPKTSNLISQLTIDEKLSLVRGGSDPHKYGQVGYTQGVPRLGIPPRRDADALGINVYKDATAVPTRLGVAASFDRGAAVRLGQLEGVEGRALHMDVLYAPQVDLARTPGWARNFTTYGEDPYLSAQMATAEISGIQSQGLMAELKHFAFYNGQVEDIPSVIDEQTAHELYLAPFEAAISAGRPSSVMCSYARFQIVPLERRPEFSCGKAGLLNGILRHQWGFEGFVLSDYGGTHDTSSLLNGLDAVFPEGAGRYFFGSRLKALVDTGSRGYQPAYAAALDTAVARILYQMERFGLLSATPPVRPQLNRQRDSLISKELSEQAAVLLKNDGDLLPLKKTDLAHLAVIGPVSTMLVSSPGGERSRGFGDRNLISPLAALGLAEPKAHLVSAPGVDRIGGVVPPSSLSTGSQAGLQRTGSDGSSQVDPTIDVARSAGLTPGVSYTWKGRIYVPTSDIYAFWLQTTTGQYCSGDDGETVVNPTGPCTSSEPSGGVSLRIDGGNASLSEVGTLLSNTYPDGISVDGQYLGLAATGAYLDFSSTPAGWHAIEVRWKPDASTVTPAIIRLRWAPLRAGIDAAVEAAKAASLALVFVDDETAGAPAPGNTSVRVSSLGKYQDDLVARVAAANPNTAVVLYTRNPVLMPWLDKVRAVLEMWYPGQEGGPATANLLLGRAVPGGKLPVTFPAASEDTPFHDHPERAIAAGPDGAVHWTEGLFIGYRWYDQQGVQPLFPFGHGLSYTKFEFSRLTVASSGGGGLDVRFRVRNVGRYAGAEVAQIYLGPAAETPAGVRQASRKLVQFERVTLAPGQAVDVALHVAVRELSYWSTEMQGWIRGAGERELLVGSSSRDVRLRGNAHVR